MRKLPGTIAVPKVSPGRNFPKALAPWSRKSRNAIWRLAAGAFPDDLEALAEAARQSVLAYRRHVALIYVDVVEFDGTHIRKFYSGMSARFASFLNQRYPDGSLKGRLAADCDPTMALMLASRIFLHYFAVEVLFGVPDQLGRDSGTATKEIAGILRHGILKP